MPHFVGYFPANYFSGSGGTTAGAFCTLISRFISRISFRIEINSCISCADIPASGDPAGTSTLCEDLEAGTLVSGNEADELMPGSLSTN